MFLPINYRHRFLLILLILAAGSFPGSSQPGTTISVREKEKVNMLDLQSLWDTVRVCSNPHKGWYFHFFDNNLTKYHNKLQQGDFLKDFPGLNHIYLRLAWSYLEPEENQYNWQVIDTVITQWVAQGYTVSFRITCKETNYQYATPEWVRKAGAAGTMIRKEGKPDVWEPDYGDPVFLEKLENFHRAFAARYDGKPWVEYVDVGSYGDWGEGHTWPGSKKQWPVDVIKKHIDIHARHYRKTLVVISDDFFGSRTNQAAAQEILDYILAKGLGVRDDSVCVKSYADQFGFSTLRDPEMFQKFWPKTPVNLELEHYHKTKEENTWKDGLPFAAAIREARATFIGFHGYPRDWLADNPALARTLANKAGYWYFLRAAGLPRTLRAGTAGRLTLYWENHGVAPAYFRGKLLLTLEGEKTGAKHTLVLQESDNRKWMPGEVSAETYTVSLPAGLKGQKYKMMISLREETPGKTVPIELGFQDRIKRNDGYEIGVVAVR